MKQRYFDLARKASFKSTYFPHKIGSIITDKRGKILGFGWNKNKTHIRSNNTWRSIHAELSAIINTGQENLSGAKIFVFRETKRGELANARPCKFCIELLKEVGISEIHYTVHNGFKEENI